MAAPPLRLGSADRPVGRRRLRILSRRFAAVGVHIEPARLAEIAAGLPASDDELFDVAFAETATRLRRDRSGARRRRAQQRVLRGAVVLVAMALALAAVLCLGLLFFTMAVHPPGT